MSDETAFFDIGYIIGGDEGHVLVEILLGMFTGWVGRLGLDHEVIKQAPAPGGGLKAAQLCIHGADHHALAALHQGTHTLIRTPPGLDRRQMSCAGVRISATGNEPWPDGMAGWGDERRRYVFDPYRSVTDAALGRLDIDPATVLAGDFSGLGGT